MDIWLRQPFLAHLKGVSQGNSERGNDKWKQIINEAGIHTVDGNGNYASNMIRPNDWVQSILDLPALPSQAQADNRGVNIAILHPLASSLQTEAAEYIFPSSLAQRNNGSLVLAGQDTIADRPVWVVDWTWFDETMRSQTYWVDAETGIVLKVVQYKEDGITPFSETIFLNIKFNGNLPQGIFDTASIHDK